VLYPIRAGNYSKSRVPIPDWTDCGAGRFTPIYTSLKAVRSSLRGPHQSDWSQYSLCKHSTLHVFCCSLGKDMSINRNNRIATPKKSLISFRQKNKYVNFAVKACHVIIKMAIFRAPTYYLLILIYWNFTAPCSVFCIYCNREIYLWSKGI